MVEQEELIKEFEGFLSTKEENTRKTYIRYAKKFATTNVQEFNKRVAHAIEQAKSNSTKHIIWESARAFEKFIKKRYSIKDFQLWIEKPKMSRPAIQYLTQEEIKLLVSAESNFKYKTIISLLFTTGMRISELTNLKLNDVDLIGHTVTIETSKNKEGRVVSIPRSMAKMLDEYIQNYRKDGSDYLFTSRTGKQMDRIIIWRHIKKLAKKVGINKNITPHTFRHSSATYLLEKGQNLRDIQERLGHKSISTTQIYTHLTNQRKRETADTFEDLL